MACRIDGKGENHDGEDSHGELREKQGSCVHTDEKVLLPFLEPIQQERVVVPFESGSC